MSEEQADYLADALEMIGIDLAAPKQIVQEISGFTPMFDVVVRQYKDETRAAVHGAMWRFCQMQDGVCKASLTTISELLGISPATVMRHAEILCKDGYFVDLTPDLKNRPHVYADTGRVVIKSKLNAHVSQRNTGISQCNVTVSESQLSKVLKKEKKDTADADSQNLQELVLESNKKVDAILKMEQEAKERENAGQAWRGRELLAPAHISYGDWWHSQTGLHMYGAKAKAKRDTGWEKAFREWEENELTVFTLQEAYNSTVAWKKTVASPNEITGTAKAMQAAKLQIKQTAPVTYDQDGAPESW